MQKELKISKDRQEIERLQKENAEEIKSLQALRKQLSQDYAALKQEKILQRARKSLLKKLEQRNNSVSASVSRHLRLIRKSSLIHDVPVDAPHSAISLTASVNPIIADSDSVPEESPVDTQESFEFYS
jgi:predicted RNA binding protein with dsRBD fold (UPF0201 family)